MPSDKDHKGDDKQVYTWVFFTEQKTNLNYS